MSQIWIEKLRSASSKVERDEILLRELNDLRRHKYLSENGRERLYDEVEEQMRDLVALALSGER